MREHTRDYSDESDDDEKWVTHYSSNHQILLVGEGDFSFSRSLATSFVSASNICASSLDLHYDVVRKYKKARSNLQSLEKRGASILHGVDATKLRFYSDLNSRRFDRIIFNFPHAGFRGKETDPSVIRRHKDLVFGFFHSASQMLRANGEIHVSHKNNAPFCRWNLEELASRCSLVLYQRVAFKKNNYRGYENKRGDGSKCDQPFPLGDCSTFKFRFSYDAKEIYADKLKWREEEERESNFPQAFISNNEPEHSFDNQSEDSSDNRPEDSFDNQPEHSFDNQSEHSFDYQPVHSSVQDTLAQSRQPQHLDNYDGICKMIEARTHEQICKNGSPDPTLVTSSTAGTLEADMSPKRQSFRRVDNVLSGQHCVRSRELPDALENVLRDPRATTREAREETVDRDDNWKYEHTDSFPITDEDPNGIAFLMSLMTSAGSPVLDVSNMIYGDSYLKIVSSFGQFMSAFNVMVASYEQKLKVAPQSKDIEEAEDVIKQLKDQITAYQEREIRDGPTLASIPHLQARVRELEKRETDLIIEARVAKNQTIDLMAAKQSAIDRANELAEQNRELAANQRAAQARERELWEKYQVEVAKIKEKFRNKRIIEIDCEIQEAQAILDLLEKIKEELNEFQEEIDEVMEAKIGYYEEFEAEQVSDDLSLSKENVV